MKKLLCVGAGFVGGTCYKVFSQLENWDVRVCDLNPEESFLKKTFDGEIKWTEEPFAKEADLIFLAVPTPMVEETGECFTKFVEDAIASLRKYNQDNWICIKSTVPPGTTQKLHEKYKRVCFNPEFLTEANALNDFINLPYQIIGSPELMEGIMDGIDNPIFDLYGNCAHEGLLNIRSGAVLEISSTQAEMVKYLRNCYLSTRLSFFNEMKQICDKLDIDYAATAYWAGLDERVGSHYNRVDPQNPGFGGHCLPKDLSALVALSRKLGVDPKVLKAVRDKNDEVRQMRDWESMENRAVISVLKENG